MSKNKLISIDELNENLNNAETVLLSNADNNVVFDVLEEREDYGMTVYKELEKREREKTGCESNNSFYE